MVTRGVRSFIEEMLLKKPKSFGKNLKQAYSRPASFHRPLCDIVFRFDSTLLLQSIAALTRPTEAGSTKLVPKGLDKVLMQIPG